jgi:hypothetical protein
MYLIDPMGLARSLVVRLSLQYPPTSQAYEWVVLSAFHSMLVVKFSRQVLSVKLGYICRMLKAGR